MTGQAVLTGEQAAALLDILTNHGTYAEIEAFKSPGGVTGFGAPFRRETRVPAGPPSRGSRTTTPGGSVPSTPRARTPVSFFWSREERRKERENGDDDVGDNSNNNNGEDSEKANESRSPLLQMLLERIVLPFPGVRELPPDFWGVRVQGLLARFGEAGLSESYDKGAMGTRKTLACGAGSVVELLARGMLCGVEEKTEESSEGKYGRAKEEEEEGEKEEEEEKVEGGGKKRQTERERDGCGRLMGEYDLEKAEDLERAWDDCVQDWAYGDLLDQLLDRFRETKDIEGHSLALQGAVDFAIVHIATFAHQVFILSPEGQYLIKLLESINNLIPYRMITQTLRVGNAALMISGMVRLLLTKLSVTSLTNWVGLTANADDGMNLLQRIIWIVLTYDASDFRKSADKIDKAKEGEEDKPPDEILLAIREHIAKSWEEHDAVRKTSLESSKSIITAVLESAGKSPQLISGMSRGQHAQCLAYYSALLSARDRESIINVLCRQPPDLFTQIVKDVIAAFDPLIRSVHARVDLREHLESFQQFLSEFIRASKPRKPESNANTNNGISTNNNGNTNEGPEKMNKDGSKPSAAGDGETRASVEDYVRLLRRNKELLYKWIHAVAKECPDVWAEMRVWAKAVAVHFRERAAIKNTGQTAKDTQYGPSKDMRGCLEDLYLSLEPPARLDVLAAIDAHAIYLSDITLQSRQRLQRILTKSASPPLGDITNDSNNEADVNADDGPDMCGPGVYLFRWQDLLDSTPITPQEARGPPCRGRDVKHTTTMGKLGLGGMIIGEEEFRAAKGPGREAPDVSVVVTALGERFSIAVREKIRRWDGLG